MATPRDYCDALDELQEADEAVTKLANELRSFADRLLAFPAETCFDYVDGEPEPPLDQLMRGMRWKAAEFPTPLLIQTAIRRRVEARYAALRLRDDLTPSQLKGAPPVPA